MKERADYICCNSNSLREFVLMWKQSFAERIGARRPAIIQDGGERIYMDTAAMPGLCTVSNGRVLLQPTFYPAKTEAGYRRVEVIDTAFIRMYEFADIPVRVKCPPCAEPLCSVQCMLVVASIGKEMMKLSMNDVLKLGMVETSTDTVAMQVEVEEQAEFSIFEWLCRCCSEKKVLLYGDSGWYKRAKAKYVKSLPFVKRAFFALGFGAPKIKLYGRRIID